MNDSTIISEIHNGSVRAFELLYDRYKRKIYSFFYKYVKNRSEAEDMLQSLFLNIWEHRSSIDQSAPFEKYIYRCASNKIYDYLRRKYVQERYLEAQKFSGDFYSENAENSIYFNDLNDSLKLIMDELPDKQKEIFYLSRYKNIPNKEIAEKLNLSVRTVETQIYRVIKKIKRNLMV